MRNAIIDYMESDDFNPAMTLDPAVVKDFFNKNSAGTDVYRRITRRTQTQTQINHRKTLPGIR